ncbi:MAG: nitrilase-related carbon-nitrogen hydrolase, partial [Ilumatobacteraceae bacterium]
MPPWGWWPLALVGLALWDWMLVGQRGPVRFRRTVVFALAWFAPALWWMWRFSAPGYVVVLIIFAVIQGLATLTIPGPPDDRWRWLVLPSALTATEALRFCFPFGGVPLASLPIGQAAGPLAGVARIGGPVLLTLVTALIGTNLRRVLQPIVTSSCPLRTRLIPTASALVFVPGVIGLGALAPRGADTGETVNVTIVQGGGPQGTRAVNTDARDAVDRTLAATRTFSGTTDVVIWPENIVNVTRLDTSTELREVAEQAARIGAPILIGVTERDSNPRKFHNYHVVVMPDGSLGSRYEKKRRVPFGEYMPMRGFLAGIG